MGLLYIIFIRGFSLLATLVILNSDTPISLSTYTFVVLQYLSALLDGVRRIQYDTTFGSECNYFGIGSTGWTAVLHPSMI